MSRIRLFAAALNCLLVAACSLPLVTTYGRNPLELSPGTYELYLYYNSDAKEADIDSKARERADELARKSDFSACEFSRDSMVSASQIKRVLVTVTCS